MSYSLPIHAKSKNIFLFIQDYAGNWVPAQSGDIGADKWAVKITGINFVSGDKTFYGHIVHSGENDFYNQVEFHESIYGTFANFTEDVFANNLEVTDGGQVYGIGFNDNRYVKKIDHFLRTVNINSGAVSLNASHTSGYFRIDNATGSTVTVSTQASASWPTEVEIAFCQVGSGAIAVTGASGVTINSSESLRTARLNSVILLKKVGTNIWDLTGERELA